MKKYALLILGMFILTTTSQAQLLNAKWMYSGSFSYQHNSFPPLTSYNTFGEKEFNFKSRIGMRISEDWYLGIQGGVQSYRGISPGKPGLISYFVPSIMESMLIDKVYYGTEENNLIAVGPYIQRFIAIGENTYLHFSAYFDYHQGTGSFTPASSISLAWRGDPSLASSYILPSPRDFKERTYGTGLQMGLSYFFTNKLALDVQAGLVEWQRTTIEDSQTVWLFYDPYITRSESSLAVLPHRLGLRLGIIVLL